MSLISVPQRLSDVGSSSVSDDGSAHPAEALTAHFHPTVADLKSCVATRIPFLRRRALQPYSCSVPETPRNFVHSASSFSQAAATCDQSAPEHARPFLRIVTERRYEFSQAEDPTASVFPGGISFFQSLFSQRYISPARETVFAVPQAFTVPQ